MAEFNPTKPFSVEPEEVSLIIPTLNAAWDLPGLFERVERQKLCPGEIIIVDSSSDDDTVEIAQGHKNVHVKVIAREDFNHGLTRHQAAISAKCIFICFMTQDAIPADDEYFQNLLAYFADPEIALVSGRQLPKPNARRFEQLIRGYNYGISSNVRSMEDVLRYGIKTYFATDVCSAYRRDAYLKAGGFPELETNEDMYMAALFLNMGYKIAYAANARVYHSHNFSFAEQYARNKAIGAFLESNREILLSNEEVGEGAKLARRVARQLFLEGDLKELAAFGLDSIARFAGNRSGRGYVRRHAQYESIDV